MEALNERLVSLGNALERLHESLIILEKLDNSGQYELYDQIRDSVIKRFEFSFDIFWKCLKDHLMNQYGIEVASPKACIRESLGQKIITNEEFPVLFDMVDDRNKTSHCYDEEMAEEIARHIKDHYGIMRTMFMRLK